MADRVERLINDDEKLFRLREDLMKDLGWMGGPGDEESPDFDESRYELYYATVTMIHMKVLAMVNDRMYEPQSK